MDTPYSNLYIVTKTYVAYSNLQVDTAALAEVLPITPMEFPPKPKEKMQVNPEETIPDGSIVYVMYNRLERGQPFKKQKKNQMACCVYFIIKFDKYYTAKISKRGILHVTGARGIEAPLNVFRTLWSFLVAHPTLWSFTNNDTALYSLIFPVMVNNKFSLGFCIDRSKLQTLALRESNYIAMFEPSDSYVGANIKVPSKYTDIENEPIHEFGDDFIPHQITYQK